MKSVGLLVITIVVLFLCSTARAERTVWYVHPDSTLNTIQAGLDSCADNDVVLVGPGIYYENIVWPNTQGIDLLSEIGPNATIIDGNSAGRVITITTGVDSTTTIEGFTIQYGSPVFQHDLGGGLSCLESSPTITGNKIICNIAAGGGGIYCYRSSTIIVDNLISVNAAIGLLAIGGGIYCEEDKSLISNNIIARNSSFDGGGIRCLRSSTHIAGNSIDSNTACYGGGISCSDDSLLISDNIISGNYSMDGGGIYCTQSSAHITDNTIAGNTADNEGGGICCALGSPNITKNTVVENSSTYRVSAGIVCKSNCLAIIDSCTISSNYGDGIVCCYEAIPALNYNNIFDNTGYGVRNVDSTVIVDATFNWWGDSTGPYHPDSNPGGLGDTVSDYVDFIPWLYWPGVEERPSVNSVVKHGAIVATIFRGPLVLPTDKSCKVFDITGRVVAPDKMRPGIYFIEVDGQIAQKVVKVR